LKWGALIPKVINSCLTNTPPVIYQNGKRTRDFTFVTDTVQGIIGVAKHAKSGEVVNIGSGDEVSVQWVLETICKLMKSTGKYNYQTQRAGDVSQLVCCNDKARKMFNYSPKVGLLEGLQKTIDYYTVLYNSKTVRS
jgi:UDP-glucose 4-epimerase